MGLALTLGSALALAVLGAGLAASRVAAIPPFSTGFEGAMEPSEADWQIDAAADCVVVAATTPTREGARSLRIDAPRDRRCEIVPRLVPAYLEMLVREPFGRERRYRFSVFVASIEGEVAPASLGDNTIVAQWHSSPDPLPRRERGRGPPLALRIHDREWAITLASDARLFSAEIPAAWHRLGRVELGRWVDWDFRVRWSHRADGMTEVWRDGTLVFRQSGPNTYNDLRGVYLKLGLYHPTADTTLYVDRVSVGE